MDIRRLSVSYSPSGSCIGAATLTVHKHKFLIWFPEGGGSGFRGDGIGDESILYTLSLNQHSITVHLETQSCTGDPQPLGNRPSGLSANQEQLSDEEEIRHKHIECVNLATTHSATLELFFLLTQNTPTSLLPTDGWVVCTSVSYVTESAVYCTSQKTGLSDFALYNAEIQISLFSLDRLHCVTDCVSMLTHGMTHVFQQRKSHNCLM